MSTEEVFRTESKDQSERLLPGESFEQYCARQKANEARADAVEDDGLGESNAESAREGMIKRKTQDWQKPKASKMKEREAAPVGEEGDDDEDEEGEEEFDAAKAKAASDERKMGKRP